MIICQLSGGFDSVAALIKLLGKGEEVLPVFIDYGQKYKSQELRSVNYTMGELNKKYKLLHSVEVIKTSIQLQMSSGNIVSDYIPVRNLVLASLTANFAIANGVNSFAVGNKTTTVRLDDPWSFSDCSVEFYDLVSKLISFCSEGFELFTVKMPLINDGVALTKAEVIKIILDEGLNINKLWSCYSDGDSPCGVCYHCLENKKAMESIK